MVYVYELKLFYHIRRINVNIAQSRNVNKFGIIVKEEICNCFCLLVIRQYIDRRWNIALESCGLRQVDANLIFKIIMIMFISNTSVDEQICTVCSTAFNILFSVQITPDYIKNIHVGVM